MTPFHFGSAERRLFGIYDPASNRHGVSRAAVVCHPLGDEHVHAYRSLRQLSTGMSRAGIHVLRFDYYGTGDSLGETGEGDITSWCRDIETAIAELKDMTGASKISLVGLRLGANLAARVAAGHPDKIESLVLWEPLPVEQSNPGGTEEPDDHRNIDLSSLTGSLPSRTLVVLTEREAQRDEFGDLCVAELAGVSPWIEERIVTGTIPLNVLQYILNWLK